MANHMISSKYKFRYEDKLFLPLSYDYQNYTFSAVEIDDNGNYCNHKKYKVNSEEKFFEMIKKFSDSMELD